MRSIRTFRKNASHLIRPNEPGKTLSNGGAIRSVKKVILREIIKRLEAIATCELVLDEQKIGKITKQAFEEIQETARLAIAALERDRWISVEEPPKAFVSVQAHMTDAGPFPSVREAYMLNDGLWFFPALGETHPVDYWRPFAEPPKEDDP